MALAEPHRHKDGEPCWPMCPRYKRPYAKPMADLEKRRAAAMADFNEMSAALIALQEASDARMAQDQADQDRFFESIRKGTKGGDA